MLHRRKLGWVVLLVIVLLLTSASAALAQGGSGDKYVFGGSYNLPAGETLNGNLYVAGGSATLATNSTVSGSVSVAGGSLTIAGNVHGDVNVIGGSVSLERTAVVDGNLNRIGGSINQVAGAVVRGTSQSGTMPRFNPPLPVVPQRPVAPLMADGPFNGLVQLILRFFGAIGMGLLLALIALVVLLVIPGPTAKVATTVAREPALDFAAGLLTLVLATLIGFPLLIACGLGLVVWLIALIALIFGWIAVGLWVGQRLFALVKLQTASSLAEAAIGTFLITWLAWVSPRCIGFLFGLVVGSIGMGAVLLTRFGTQPSGGLAGIDAGRAGGGPGHAGAYRLPDREAPRETPGPGSAQPAVAAGTVSPAGAAMSWPVPEAAEPPAAGDLAVDAPPVDLPAAGPQAMEPPPAPVGEEPATRGWPEESGTDAAEQPVSRGRAGSLEDLEAVKGITPEIAERLRGAGSTTLIALATADVATLAGQAGVARRQVVEEDWIGQARRLLG